MTSPYNTPELRIRDELLDELIKQYNLFNKGESNFALIQDLKKQYDIAFDNYKKLEPYCPYRFYGDGEVLFDDNADDIQEKTYNYKEDMMAELLDIQNNIEKNIFTKKYERLQKEKQKKINEFISLRLYNPRTPWGKIFVNNLYMKDC